MNLLGKVDKFLENPYLPREPRKMSAFYPSQSSCEVKNEYDETQIAGTCLRICYWDFKAIKHTNPMNARSVRITKCGKMLEQFEVEQYKRLGIWRGNNVKFQNQQYNLSGEVDCLVLDEEKDKIIGVEIKTGYDYMFRKEVIGTKTRKGKPKLNHLLQVMLYITHFKIPFKMVYIDRGNAAREEYDITLNNDGTPNINDIKLDNGMSVPACISRFNNLERHLKDSTVPPRDFQLKYNQDRVEFLHDSNRLSKKLNKEFEKNRRLDIGDWQCSYCQFKDYCWKDQK